MGIEDLFRIKTLLRESKLFVGFQITCRGLKKLSSAGRFFFNVGLLGFEIGQIGLAVSATDTPYVKIDVIHFFFGHCSQKKTPQVLA